MKDDPIFVAGLERTGTSLMYALLASHPNISMTRRTNFWRYFADQYGDLADDHNLDACLAKMRVYKRLVALEIDFAGLRAEFETGPRTYGRLYGLLQEQVATRRGKPRWGDKSLNTERYTDRLFEDYPRARILHMMRDPRDRLASVLARWKTRRGAVGVGTAAWLWSARMASRNVVRHPERYRIVRYESLVRDPEAELHAICAFIGEPYDPSMLTMGGAGGFRDEGSNSSYGPRSVGVISTDSIRKYDRVLNPRQVSFIQTAAGQEMTDHGYEIDPVSMSTSERARAAFLDGPRNRAVMAAWRSRESLDNRRGRKLPDYRVVAERP